MGVGEYNVNDNKNGLSACILDSTVELWRVQSRTRLELLSGSAYLAFVRWKDWELEYPGLKELTLPQLYTQACVSKFRNEGVFCTLQCMWRELREHLQGTCS